MRLALAVLVMTLVGCATAPPPQKVAAAPPAQRRDAHVNLTGAELLPAGMFR